MINISYPWKDNPVLFHSLLRDDYDTFVAKLFDYTSLINTTNALGESLLHYACFYGIIDKYYALINMGATVQKTMLDNNLLHYASLSGRDDFLIVELIKLGISPIQANARGQTSVHLSSNERICHYLNLWCQRNNVLITQLTDHGANTVAHTSHSLMHRGSTHYWSNNYEALKKATNKQGLFFYQTPPEPDAWMCPMPTQVHATEMAPSDRLQ